MNTGKALRMRRILGADLQRTFIMAMDHGFSDGPISGLENISDSLKRIRGDKDTPNAIVVHQGMVSRIAHLLETFEDLSLFVHLSGSTSLSPDSNDKGLVCSVEQAIRLGADGVSVHINLGAQAENQMLADLGKVSQLCQQWGMPLLAMMYPRGEMIKNPYDPQYIGHAIRVAMEMGVDIIKTLYTGDVESFSSILDSVDSPVVIAGGPRIDSPSELLQLVHDALKAGAAGVCFGRNVFQSDQANQVAKAIKYLVHQNVSVEEAVDILRNEP